MAREGSAADPHYVQDVAPASIAANGTLSAGAAAADTVIADTGALPAGDYEVEVTMGIWGSAAAGKGLVCEHRNAANAANQSVLGGMGAGGGPSYFRIKRITIALNERIRVKVSDTVALAASEKAIASVRAYKLV